MAGLHLVVSEMADLARCITSLGVQTLTRLNPAWIDAPPKGLPSVVSSTAENAIAVMPSAVNVYRNGDATYTVGPASLVSSYNGWIVTQCWQDDIWPFGLPRLLPHHPTVPIPAEEMTVEKCINGCSASHYTSTGLEWGLPSNPLSCPYQKCFSTVH